MSWRNSALFGALLFISFTAVAEKKNYQIPRIDTAPTIDAVMAADEWASAEIVDLAYEINPGDNTKSSVKTSAYMMEDGEFIYFAFVAEDPDPEKILAYLKDRDSIFQDDFVGVVIDTFNDERRGFEFFVNPLGVQGDLTKDDIRFREDSSWDAVWDSAGQLTDTGYVVEMAIPYRAVRFPSGLEEQTWGINFLRIYPRKSRIVMSDSPSSRDLDCSLCQINKVKGMPNLESGNNLDVTPTYTYVKSENRDVEGLNRWDSESNSEVGVDLRWAVTEDWILNATVNPDFSQIEADAGQLDINTTFSLFYPEARPFFLDGADYFASANRLVHTRNIADPDYGIKLSGKSDGNSAGMIIAKDTNTSFLLPSSEYSDIAILDDFESEVLIARYQRDIGDKNNIGALVTHRTGQGYSNTVSAIDGKYYFTESDSIEVQYMHSDSTNPEYLQNNYEVEAEQSDDAYSIRYNRRTRNYGLRAAYNDFGKDFRADMGFVSRVNYKKVVLGGSYTWYGKEGSDWTRWGLFGDWDRTEDQAGKLLEEESELHFTISGPMQFTTRFGIVSRDRIHNDKMFDEERFMMFFRFKPLNNLTVGNFLITGDDIDVEHTQRGKINLYEPFVNWQMGRHFNVRFSATRMNLNVSEGQLFKAKLYDTRLAYQFNIRTRLSLTLQTIDIKRNRGLYRDQAIEPRSKTFGTQLIYSYKINPLSLVYLGYSDSAVDNDDIGGLEKTDKSIFAKFSYTWQY